MSQFTLMKIYLEACSRVVKSHLTSAISKECFGCRHNKCSQRDHDMCLMTPYEDQLRACLPAAINRASRTEITEEFTKLVREDYANNCDSEDPDKRYGVLDVLDFLEFDGLSKVQYYQCCLKELLQMLLEQEKKRLADATAANKLMDLDSD